MQPPNRSCIVGLVAYILSYCHLKPYYHSPFLWNEPGTFQTPMPFMSRFLLTILGDILMCDHGSYLPYAISAFNLQVRGDFSILYELTLQIYPQGTFSSISVQQSRHLLQTGENYVPCAIFYPT